MAVAKYSLTVIDCPDPVALANFYSQLTAFEMEPLGEMNPKDVKWFDLLRDGKAVIGFQRVENYVAPTWPEGPTPQQIHLDFDVADLDLAEVAVLELGATKAEFQSSEKFRVYLDPVGHPFCLVHNLNL